MPELPDLQVFSHNLQHKLKGKTVAKVIIVNGKKLKTTEAALHDALEGNVLEEVYREGKELRFKFKDKTLLGMHLMLHGKIELYKGEHPKHTIAALTFKDDSCLALTDYQGAANVTLNPEKSNVPDALDKEMNYTYLKERLGKTKSVIKNVLLDQKVIRGIGNAYADEILWDAGISPASISNKIPDDKIKDLVRSINSVLKNAGKEITKARPDIISGEFRDFMNIHNSKKTHSPTGGVIHTTTASSRKTYYTDEQELYK